MTTPAPKTGKSPKTPLLNQATKQEDSKKQSLITKIALATLTASAIVAAVFTATYLLLPLAFAVTITLISASILCVAGHFFGKQIAAQPNHPEQST